MPSQGSPELLTTIVLGTARQMQICDGDGAAGTTLTLLGLWNRTIRLIEKLF